MYRFLGILPALTVPLVSFAGGYCSGLLGTGGGILFLMLLRHHRPGSVRFLPETDRDRDAGKDACAAALLCVLPLSAMSAALYAADGAFSEIAWRDTVPYLLGAVPGGILGARLLDRLRITAVEYLFTALVLFAGIRMIL